MLAFRSKTMRVWGGFGPLAAGDGFTYDGLAGLGQLSAIAAGPGGSIDEITAQLFGSDELIGDIEGDASESVRQPLTVKLAFSDVRQFDEAGNWVDFTPLDQPLMLFRGTMGPMTIEQPPGAADGNSRVTRTISIPVQNLLINRARPPYQFFSDRDQKARSPTDNIFLRVSQYSEGSVRWPIF